MASSFIKSLPDIVKPWFAKAVAGMVLADGRITPPELYYLEGVIMFLGDEQEVVKIVKMVKTKTKPQLPCIKTDSKTAGRMLLELATVALKNGNFSSAEADYFHYIADRLGFELYFSKKALEWAKEFTKVEQAKNKLIKEAETCCLNV